MIKIKCFVLAVFIFTLNACKKENSSIDASGSKPFAEFTFIVGKAPQESVVSFTNYSQDAKTFTWDFGDGTTSTESNPKHFYQNAGSYTVKLTAINSVGTETIEKTVVVSAPYKTCKIVQIILEGYADGQWDAGNNLPDVYLKMVEGTDSYSTRDVKFYDDYQAGGLAEFRFNTPYPMSPLTRTITFSFWDKDNNTIGDADDYMGEFVFTPIDYAIFSEPFPYILSFKNAKIEGRIVLWWEY